jgi:hypothetical protein
LCSSVGNPVLVETNRNTNIILVLVMKMVRTNEQYRYTIQEITLTTQREGQRIHQGHTLHNEGMTIMKEKEDEEVMKRKVQL